MTKAMETKAVVGTTLEEVRNLAMWEGGVQQPVQPLQLHLVYAKPA